MRTLDSIKEVALPYHLIEENGLQVGFLLPQRNTVVEISPLADVIALPYVVLRCACAYCFMLGFQRTHCCYCLGGTVPGCRLMARGMQTRSMKCIAARFRLPVIPYVPPWHAHPGAQLTNKFLVGAEAFGVQVEVCVPKL